MKLTRFLLTAMIVFAGSFSFAQKSFVGIAAGVNIATQRTTGHPGPYGVIYFDNTVQSATSVFYHRDFAHGIGARLGAGYWQLGYRGLNINYATIPLSLVYRLNNRLSVSGGPYLSFTINNSTVESSPASPPVVTSPITSWYHKNDTGFTLGAEFDVYKNVGVGVNYIVGTKNIWLFDDNGTYSYNNRALQFTLIYKFVTSTPKP
jgi:hypothetical protein